MERASGRGYIDYGVSLRSGWVTDKGNQLIEAEVTNFRGLATARISDAAEILNLAFISWRSLIKKEEE